MAAATRRGSTCAWFRLRLLRSAARACVRMYRMLKRCPRVLVLLWALRMHCQHALSMLSRVAPRYPLTVGSPLVCGGAWLLVRIVMSCESVCGVPPTSPLHSCA